MRSTALPAGGTRVYSWRADPAVPAFDDGGPVVFMDGECVFCTLGARIIVRLDRKREFRICPTQSRLGRAVLIHHDIDPDDPDSWLYLVDGRAYGSIDAMVRAGRRLGGLGRLIGVLGLLPAPLANRVYRLVARNRYRVFGRTDMCAAPDPELRKRLIG